MTNTSGSWDLVMKIHTMKNNLSQFLLLLIIGYCWALPAPEEIEQAEEGETKCLHAYIFNKIKNSIVFTLMSLINVGS